MSLDRSWLPLSENLDHNPQKTIRSAKRCIWRYSFMAGVWNWQIIKHVVKSQLVRSFEIGNTNDIYSSTWFVSFLCQDNPADTGKLTRTLPRTYLKKVLYMLIKLLSVLMNIELTFLCDLSRGLLLPSRAAFQTPTVCLWKSNMQSHVPLFKICNSSKTKCSFILLLTISSVAWGRKKKNKKNKKTNKGTPGMALGLWTQRWPIPCVRPFWKISTPVRVAIVNFTFGRS